MPSFVRRRSPLVFSVYDDCKHSNSALLQCLQGLRRDGTICRFDLVTAADILDGYLDQENPKLFIIPGGPDLYYCDRLNGQGNLRIQRYIEEGGNYLGICGGAYYACAQLEYGRNEISGSRELALLKACACGPIDVLAKQYKQESFESDMVTAAVEIRPAAGESFYTLYWSGPQFKDIDDTYETLACFADLKESPAVVKKNFGQGIVILSAVHFEYTERDIRNISYSIDKSDFTPPEDMCGKIKTTEAGLKAFQQKIWDILTL